MANKVFQSHLVDLGILPMIPDSLPSGRQVEAYMERKAEEFFKAYGSVTREPSEHYGRTKELLQRQCRLCSHNSRGSHSSSGCCCCGKLEQT
jgi:rubrerythrin